MVFSSLTFLLYFLPVVVLLYVLLPNFHWKNGVLIVASLLFYAWGEPKWVFVMIAMVLVNYACGILIEKNERKWLRRLFMAVGVGFSLGFLFYFKYASFIINTVLSLFTKDTRIADIALPIGISFYTFQVLTYVIDVYMGKVKAQKNFFRLLLYVSFFPQLIAGPIINYKDIEKELKVRFVTAEGLYHGFVRFVIGLAKKCILANTCGEVVAALDGKSGSLLGVWGLAICFSLQLYFDFCGYSDMAIGLGKMFGFHFKENFNNPYVATSATDFWRRWHISLGAFFREYVYIPMGGNRCKEILWVRNILVVWGLTGIWHGASWNFMLWGLYYGIILLIEKKWILKLTEKIPAIFRIMVTLVVVIVGWMLFYFTDLSAGLSHIGKMFGYKTEGLTDPYAVYYLKENLGFILLAVLVCFPWKEKLEKHKNKEIEMVVKVLKPIVASLLLIISLALLEGQSYNPFLYFRF